MRSKTNTFSKVTFPSSTGRVLIPLMFASVFLVACSRTYAIESVRSGRWNDPCTWDTGQVPITPNSPAAIANLNDVNINPGHNVWLAEEQVSEDVVYADAAWARNLTIFPGGSLTATFTLQPINYGAVPVMIWANQFTNNGLVRGAPSTPIAGNINICSLGITPTFVNNGTIQGLNGPLQGGWIDIGGFAPVVTSWWMATNNGMILGGNGGKWGGGVRIVAITATNSGQMIGGFGENGGPSHVWGWSTATNNNMVQGGDGTRGGAAMVFALGTPGSTALNNTGASIIGGSMGGAAGLLAIQKTNLGTIRAGSGGRVVSDPCQGEITGTDVNVFGETLEFAAADTLIIGDLNEANSIRAEADIVITIAPGGTLDLRNNTAGTNWISAGNSITIQADNILLDDGVDINDIMGTDDGNEPVVTSGGRYAHLLIPPEQTIDMVPDTNTTTFLCIANVGNTNETVDYNIQTTGKTSWATINNPTGSFNLSPMDVNYVVVDINVPSDAMRADSVTITLNVATQQTPVEEATTNLTIRVQPYLGDFDLDGDVDYLDLGNLVKHWLEICDGNGVPDECEEFDVVMDDQICLSDIVVFGNYWLKGVE